MPNAARPRRRPGNCRPAGSRSPPERGARHRARARRCTAADARHRAGRGRGHRRDGRLDVQPVTTCDVVTASHRSTTSMSTRRSGTPEHLLARREHRLADPRRSRPGPGRTAPTTVSATSAVSGPGLLDAAAAGAHPVHGVDGGAEHAAAAARAEAVGPERRVQQQRVLRAAAPRAPPRSRRPAPTAAVPPVRRPGGARSRRAAWRRRRRPSSAGSPARARRAAGPPRPGPTPARRPGRRHRAAPRSAPSPSYFHVRITPASRTRARWMRPRTAVSPAPVISAMSP